MNVCVCVGGVGGTGRGASGPDFRVLSVLRTKEDVRRRRMNKAGEERGGFLHVRFLRTYRNWSAMH